MRVRSRRSSRQQRNFRLVVASLTVVVVGMLLPSVISGISTVVMAPVHAVNSWLENSSSLVPTFFRDRRSLEEEIKDLKSRLAVSSRIDLTQDRLWEENNRLRSLLGIAGEERIAAAVIARPNELPYDLLEIDRGSDSGIEVGSPVFIGKDAVIGLVVHVTPKYSFVELVTTPGFEASAFISGPNVVVTMEGMGGGVARVRVPQGVPLRVNDLVYLPSIEPGVFGRISYVENLPTQPEQYGYISPDIPLSGIYQVAVGKQSQIAQSTEEIEENIRTLIKKSLLVKDVSVGLISPSTPTSTDDSIVQ